MRCIHTTPDKKIRFVIYGVGPHDSDLTLASANVLTPTPTSATSAQIHHPYAMKLSPITSISKPEIFQRVYESKTAAHVLRVVEPQPPSSNHSQVSIESPENIHHSKKAKTPNLQIDTNFFASNTNPKPPASPSINESHLAPLEIIRSPLKLDFSFSPLDTTPLSNISYSSNQDLLAFSQTSPDARGETPGR